MLGSELPLYLPPCATFCLFCWTGPLSLICQNWQELQSQTTPSCKKNVTIFNNILKCDGSAQQQLKTRQVVWLVARDVSSSMVPPLRSSSSFVISWQIATILRHYRRQTVGEGIDSWRIFKFHTKGSDSFKTKKTQTHKIRFIWVQVKICLLLHLIQHICSYRMRLLFL